MESFGGAARSVLGSEYQCPHSVVKKVEKDRRLAFHWPLVALLTIEPGADIPLVGGELRRTGNIPSQTWTESVPKRFLEAFQNDVWLCVLPKAEPSSLVSKRYVSGLCGKGLSITNAWETREGGAAGGRKQ